MNDPTGNAAEAYLEPRLETAASEERAVPAQPKPVELDRLQEICCGDREFERELIDVFLTDSLERIRTMESALQERNQEIFRVQAHSIKGASANAGAETMTAIAHSLEQVAVEGNGGTAERLVQDMKQEYEKVRIFLTRYLDTQVAAMDGAL